MKDRTYKLYSTAEAADACLLATVWVGADSVAEMVRGGMDVDEAYEEVFQNACEKLIAEGKFESGDVYFVDVKDE